MDIEDAKRRFAEEVKLRGYDDKYIDKNEEREILQIGIRDGISVDAARAALLQVSDANGYVVESKVASEMKDLLETLSANDGKIDDKEYSDALSMARKRTLGKRTDVQLKQMLDEIIAANNYKTTFRTTTNKPTGGKESKMDVEDVKSRFSEEVKLRAYDDKYIDKNEEREILQIGIQAGIGVDGSRAALLQVCDTNGYVVESKVMSEMKDLLDTLAGNDGKIDEKEFNDAMSMARKRTMGKRTDNQIKRMLVTLIDDNGYKTSKGWFSSWYDKVKKEVG